MYGMKKFSDGFNGKILGLNKQLKFSDSIKKENFNIITKSKTNNIEGGIFNFSSLIKNKTNNPIIKKHNDIEGKIFNNVKNSNMFKFNIGLNTKQKSLNSNNILYNNTVHRPEQIGWNRMNKQKRLSLFGDKDKDGVPNIFDCDPWDGQKQAIIHKYLKTKAGKLEIVKVPTQTEKISPTSTGIESVGKLETYNTQPRVQQTLSTQPQEAKNISVIDRVEQVATGIVKGVEKGAIGLGKGLVQLGQGTGIIQTQKERETEKQIQLIKQQAQLEAIKLAEQQKTFGSMQQQTSPQQQMGFTQNVQSGLIGKGLLPQMTQRTPTQKVESGFEIKGASNYNLAQASFISGARPQTLRTASFVRQSEPFRDKVIHAIGTKKQIEELERERVEIPIQSQLNPAYSNYPQPQFAVPQQPQQMQPQQLQQGQLAVKTNKSVRNPGIRGPYRKNRQQNIQQPQSMPVQQQ